jgi:ubiquitin-like 1-activating enzyme E1 B
MSTSRSLKPWYVYTCASSDRENPLLTALHQVAKDSAGKFNPNVKIEAYHDNILDARFNVAWFKGFDIVFNALDNLKARQHVNKMCLAANVPLIESGTTGFNGQVQVIKKVRIT